MESECPTPYNSLYVPVKKGQVVCCKHGLACEVARKEKEREQNGEDNVSEQYVNLIDTKKDANKTRDELIQSLAGRLKELEERNARRKGKKRSKHRRAREERMKEEEKFRKIEQGRQEQVSRRKTGEGARAQEEKAGSRRRERETNRRDGREEVQDEDDFMKRKEEGESEKRNEEGKRRREHGEHKRRHDKSRRTEDDLPSDYDSSSRKLRKVQNREERLMREEHSPTSSPKSDRALPGKKSHPQFHKPATLRDSTGDSSKESKRKLRKTDTKSSDFSSSVSRGLVGDLDVSKSTKSRRKKEKKRRERRERREESTDDRQMFESIRNIMPHGREPVEETQPEVSKPDPVSGRSAAITQQPLTGVAKSVYIGVCNFAKAEEQVEKRSDFRVYHQLAHRPLLDDLEQELPLIVVYKTANGSFRHYPIRRRKVGSSSYYYVDYGDPKVQAHASLDHLVRYYQINAQRHPNNRQYADQFPWWEVHL